MKLHVLSDLHLEFDPFPMPSTDAEVVILAGDIDVGVGGFDHKAAGRGNLMAACSSARAASGRSVCVRQQCDGKQPFSGCMARMSASQYGEFTPSTHMRHSSHISERLNSSNAGLVDVELTGHPVGNGCASEGKWPQISLWP